MAENNKVNSVSFFNSRLTSIISIALVLFLLGLILLMGLLGNQLSVYVRENISFSIVLKDNQKEADIKRMQKSLDALPFIKSTEYISKEQAAKELEGTGIKLMKVGEAKVPTIKEYLEQVLKEGQSLGFDGRVVKANDAKDYEEILGRKKGRLVWDKDLGGEAWPGRPALLHQPVFLLDERYSGEGASSKIARVREKMKEEGAQIHILTTLDDIAWLLNLRGNDVQNSPVFLAYGVITMDKALLFAQEEKGGEEAWPGNVRAYLEENGVTLLPYEDFYPYLPGIHGKKILLQACQPEFKP